jgi:hypothetical protein
LTVTESTVSGNRATSPAGGGGFYLSYSTTAVIRNSTIAFNTATYAGGIYSRGGAVIESSIVTKNIGGGAPDLAGRAKVTFSLIGDTIQVNFDTGSANNVLNRDPLLGPQADNGGPTRTHALLP